MPCHKRAPPGSSSFTASKTQQKAETGLWLLNLLLCSGLPLSVYNELCPGAPGHQGCVGAGADGSRQPTEHPAGRGSPPGRVPCAGRRCHHPACRAAGSRVGSCCCLSTAPAAGPKGAGPTHHAQQTGGSGTWRLRSCSPKPRLQVWCALVARGRGSLQLRGRKTEGSEVPGLASTEPPCAGASSKAIPGSAALPGVLLSRLRGTVMPGRCA